MPVYEYQCDECNHKFEIMQKIDEVPKKICPKCHRRKLRRLISAPAIIFKGTGWTPKSNQEYGGM